MLMKTLRVGIKTGRWSVTNVLKRYKDMIGEHKRGMHGYEDMHKDIEIHENFLLKL